MLLALSVVALALVSLGSLIGEEGEPGVEVTYSTVNDWENGFQGDFFIENLTSETLEAWELEFTLDCAIDQIWNATIRESGEGAYRVDAADYDWQADIPSGSTASFGFTALPGNLTQAPSQVSLLHAGSPAPTPTATPTPEPSPSETDSDEDGMSDAYETTYGLDPSIDDALFDPDGDRVPNLFESGAETDPHDPGSVPALAAQVGGANATHSDLQAAVSEVEDLAVIGLASGLHTGNVAIPAGKRLLLLGEQGRTEGPAVIEASAEGPALAFVTDAVIDSIVITRQEGTAGAGVQIAPETSEDSGRLKLVNVVVTGQAGPAILGGANASRIELQHGTLPLLPLS